MTLAQRRFQWRAYRAIRETAPAISRSDARYAAAQLTLIFVKE